MNIPGACGVIFAMSLVGCSTVPIVPQPVVIREPAPTPIPLTVAVHYSDAFRSYVYPDRLMGVGTYAIGQASVKLFDEAFALLFGKVVTSDTSPSAVVSARVDPAIALVSYCFPPCGTGIITRASVTYTVALRAPDGRELARWDVAGVGATRFDDAAPMFSLLGIRVVVGKTSMKHAFELAMRDAAFKLVNQFREVPGVSPWLMEQGVTASGTRGVHRGRRLTSAFADRRL